MQQHGYLYIIHSHSNDHFYIGSTMNPDRRLEQHNANANKATRNKGPWKRLALLQFPDLPLAKKAEQWLKRMKSRRIIELICTGEFEWKPEFQLLAVVEDSQG